MSEDAPIPHRSRLLLAMASAVAEKGYASVTIADVVARANVSKRTFYEHFGSKEDCLLACYADGSDGLMTVTAAAAAALPPGPERVSAAIDAYYAALDGRGPLVVALLTEIQAVGAAGRAMRRQKIHEFAKLIRDLVAEGATAGAPVSLDVDESIALCGGLYELALTHAEEHPDQPFSGLAPVATRFVLAVLRKTPAPA